MIKRWFDLTRAQFQSTPGNKAGRLCFGLKWLLAKAFLVLLREPPKGQGVSDRLILGVLKKLFEIMSLRGARTALGPEGHLGFAFKTIARLRRQTGAMDCFLIRCGGNSKAHGVRQVGLALRPWCALGHPPGQNHIETVAWTMFSRDWAGLRGILHLFL